MGSRIPSHPKLCPIGGNAQGRCTPWWHPILVQERFLEKGATLLLVFKVLCAGVMELS